MMGQKEEINKFHDDLGKLVFGATAKVPIQRVICELELIKTLVEIDYLITVKEKVGTKINKDVFDRMYG